MKSDPYLYRASLILFQRRNLVSIEPSYPWAVRMRKWPWIGYTVKRGRQFHCSGIHSSKMPDNHLVYNSGGEVEASWGVMVEVEAHFSRW